MGEARFQLSHSKVRSFQRCRKQYWFRFLSGQPPPPPAMNAAGIVGVGVHRAMRALCETGAAEDGQAVLDVYLRMPAHESAGPGTEAYAEAFALFGQGCIAHDSIVSEYTRVEYHTWVHAYGMALEARIDRADRLAAGHWQIIDWKTGRWELDEVTDDQLDICHAALRTAQQLRRDVTVTAIAWNLRTGAQRVRALHRDDAMATLRRLGRVAGQMQQTTEFPADPSPECRYCDWRSRCPEADAAERGVD